MRLTKDSMHCNKMLCYSNFNLVLFRIIWLQCDVGSVGCDVRKHSNRVYFCLLKNMVLILKLLLHKHTVIIHALFVSIQHLICLLSNETFDSQGRYLNIYSLFYSQTCLISYHISLVTFFHLIKAFYLTLLHQLCFI